MTEVDDIFKKVENFSKAMCELYKIKAEKIHQRRIKAQNNPLVKQRKSRAMKEYWAKKKEEEQKEREERDYINSLSKEELHPSCTCFLGNPPCAFCTDSNYCEECNIQTWDNYCPECGKLIGEEE